jgi:hypothetical protein
MKRIRFENENGKEIRTTLPEDIMKQVANLTEVELKRKGIFYTRNGTEFDLFGKDVKHLFDAQAEATKLLIERGVITIEMILSDLQSNF